MRYPFRRKRDASRQLLAAALEAWTRPVPAEETLAGPTRDRILRRASATDGAGAPLPAPLFAPRRWLVVAAVVPALLGALLILGLRRQPQVPESHTRVQAYKAGGEVVFAIANGKREHVVYRSARPDRFDPASAVRVRDGVYRDSLAAGDIVFYRID